MRTYSACLTGLSLIAISPALLSHPAQACGGRASATLSALPASGATDVSPMTSIILVTGSSAIPTTPTLQAGGQVVTGLTVEALGSGLLGEKGASFWRLHAGLSPSTSYTLQGLENGVQREATGFTTAAAYDKTPGQAPVLDRLRLWRVHYPVEQVGAGGCVFSEYEGYIDLDYQDGSVPNTPSAEIVSVLSLQPKTGGTGQSFVFAGRAHFDGAQIENALGSALIDIPDGAFPSPVYALWKPSLEPDREYCATLTLFGRNDLAMPAVISNSVCAQVTNMDARPAPPDAGVATPDAVATPIADALDAQSDTYVPQADATAATIADANSTSPDTLIPPPDVSSDQPAGDQPTGDQPTGVVFNSDASPATTDTGVPLPDAYPANLADTRAPMPDAAVLIADAGVSTADGSSQSLVRTSSRGCSCSLGDRDGSGPLVLLWCAVFLILSVRRRNGASRR